MESHKNYCQSFPLFWRVKPVEVFTARANDRYHYESISLTTDFLLDLENARMKVWTCSRYCSSVTWKIRRTAAVYGMPPGTPNVCTERRRKGENILFKLKPNEPAGRTSNVSLTVQSKPPQQRQHDQHQQQLLHHNGKSVITVFLRSISPLAPATPERQVW